MATTARFRDRTIVVTGGGSGIGRATALRLAAEGAAVFLAGRTQAKLEQVASEVRAAGSKAAFDAGDLRDDAACRRVAEGAARLGGGAIHGVVNCAGTFPSAPFPQLSDRDWQDAIENNLSGPMRMARAALAHLKQGAVVFVSSTNAIMGDKLSQCSHYSAAKAGLLGLTRQLAIELAPKIRVNAIVPGAVKTPMLEGWNEDPAEMNAWLKRFVPLERIARPEDIAGVVAFLASDDAAYVTGATIVADGGMHVV